MIINGGSRCNGRFFAKHLSNAEENEHVTLCEIRNLAAQGIAGALREMEAVSLGTWCKNYFYHANINPLATEPLTPEQWMHAVDTLEERLGLYGHARLVVEHAKKGRTHRHVIWLRIDVHSMRAVEMTNDYERHQATARLLEEEFELQRGQSVLGAGRQKGNRPLRRPKSWESFRAHKSGLDPYRMTQAITSLFHGSEDGMEFGLKLRERGYRLVRGDRTAFCIVDPEGNKHSLARRLTGVTAHELSGFMKDVPVTS